MSEVSKLRDFAFILLWHHVHGKRMNEPGSDFGLRILQLLVGAQILKLYRVCMPWSCSWQFAEPRMLRNEAKVKTTCSTGVAVEDMRCWRYSGKRRMELCDERCTVRRTYLDCMVSSLVNIRVGWIYRLALHLLALCYVQDASLRLF